MRLPAEPHDSELTSAVPGTSLAVCQVGLIGDERLNAADDYYGVPDQSTLDAIRLLGRLEGVILDPVYEGKPMAGLISLATSGEIGKDSTVLYAHLGGQPVLSAYGSLFC